MFNLLWNKPKPERFSLENLKSLCAQLQQFPGDANEESIVSCLKELTQLLIWGDQHDPSLLEHFFEQNVHWHFLKILQSKDDGTLIVQVLQTLNIMFENVRSRQSLYFLLSNNYVNQVIGLRYDFSNDEILAYYIYLLRTLSFKLSKDTIYFFFNEHLDDFPLYSEAIKFFNHEESMVRIAVRVITLNVYSVNDRQMQDFILDRTTTTYFSNLVWFIGNYGTTVNDMLLHPGEGEFSRMNYYLAEHMDCFYYVNDIIELEVPKINKILISHLLNRLLRPMYLDSLHPSTSSNSNGNKSSTSAKLTPLVAMSLMLHAFHVLKHAPLVSALTSTLFSSQHYTTYSHGTPPPNLRHSPTPLALGNLTISPDSSRPSSPVTSKFQSFGLLGTSPAGFESFMPSLSAPTARFNHQHSLAPSHASGATQQQNPFKAAIYGYLSQVDSDRLVLPALLLVYLTGRNPGVMPDVLLGTDIYPQRLLKSKMLMGNLMSSSSPPVRTQPGATPMSRDRSSDSILSTNSTGVASSVVWTTPPPGLGISSSITGSLFGAAGSAARMRTRTESPLFETDEADEESRETEELLACADSQLAEPPASSPNRRRTGTGPLSTSLPSSSNMSSLMSRNLSTDVDSQSKRKPRSGGRRSNSKPSSLLGPVLSSGSDAPPSMRHLDAPAMVQELKPVFTSKEDREGASMYPSTDEEGEGKSSRQAITSGTKNLEQDSVEPPPLPPRPSVEQQQDENASIQESVSTQVAPIIQNREELMDRLVDIICGQPESGAHRFRVLTIQVAAELLIEFVYTKGGAGKETAAAQAAQQAAAESQLGEARLYRLALAEVQTRDRVQKGIRALEKKKKSNGGGAAGQAGAQDQPLGMLTGRVERSLTESKLGMDKQVVNVIAESSVIYGPDRDLENELDLNPDPELVKLFDLDPEFTSMSPDKLSMGDDDKTLKGSIDLPPTSNNSSGSSTNEGRRARMKSKIKSKMQGPTAVNSHQQPSPSPHPHRPSPTALSRLEAMVVRYIKWLHILIQCRQLLCRNPAAATAAISASFSQDSLSVTSTVSGTLAGAVVQAGATKSDSPTISITESTTAPGTLDRRPSDFLGTGNISTGNLSGASTPAKAPATTATTTSTTAMAVGPDASGLGAKLVVAAGGLLPVGSSLTSSPSTQANSTVSSASSSTSSLSSMSSSSAAQAMLSQPATGTASGRIIGSRTLLTATAALEAAAHTNQQQQQQHNLASTGGSHPFMNEMNEMLSTHLDPLSISVSEVIRKSSAKIKKSVVDPLAANPLFRSVSNASSSLAVGLGGGGSNEERASGGGGGGRGASAVSSAASSMRSVKSRSSAVLPVGMERTVSAASSASISAASVVGGGDDTDVAKAEDTETEKEAVAAAAVVVETVSILDPSHPAHQSDEQVIKILETLGLKSVAASEVSIEHGPTSSRAASIISS
ncbi:Protein CL16A [Linnemannia hyalina]|uniref:Protein CL16A n=1 Tax=Linnemannia hyalina TaxID=64524 RepID=A0A9P8BVI3_9FUNG|nr:Protein CL16A [Linnemannia hyalina]